MTEDRRSLAPIRQLSLQSTSSRQRIARHRSADDEKSLQVYTNPGARGKLIGNGKTSINRPKVRIAWDETHRKSENQSEKVEVVAHQIPGNLKPNAGRYRPFSGSEKASILFSRQQLAERLRLAWKHREENKSNIDIVLAHNVHEERSDSALSSQENFAEPSTPCQEKASSDMCNVTFPRAPTNETEKQQKEEKSPIKPEELNSVKQISKDDFSSAKQKRASFQSGTNKAFLTITKSTDEKQKPAVDDAQLSPTLDNTAINKPLSSKTILKNDRDISDLDQTLKSVASRNHPKSDMKFRDVSAVEAATQEIASNLINMSPKVPQDKDNSQVKVKITKANQPVKSNQYGKAMTPRRSQSIQNIDPRARRTNSAPPQRTLGSAGSGNRVQVNIVIDTASTTKSSEKNMINCQRTIECQETNNRIERFDSALSKVSFNRPTRSAPLKRRSKSSKRRLFSGLSKADEDTTRPGPRKSGVDPKTLDLVTMVSLVSSADSDSDIENSPGDDNLINELRSKLPTTPIIKASINPVVPRRPIKSVSFQNDSFDEEVSPEQIPAKEEKRNNTRFGITNNREKVDVPVSCNDSVQKQETPGLVLPSLILAHDTDQLSDVQLTDREKRCLAVPIGDLHDKKRKLLKTRSTPSRPHPICPWVDLNTSALEKQAVSNELKEQDANAPRIRPVPVPLLPDKTTLESFSQIEDTLIGEKAPEETQVIMCEPHFRTPKEKECWQLYRRMCDKGVCVSFDTVLRGMLTPTEYRLRQKELQDS